MPLTLLQITKLAAQIYQEWDTNRLTLFAADFEVPLANSPQGDLRDRAMWFIGQVTSVIPSRDREMLQALQTSGPPGLQRLASELLKPGFFPPGNPYQASILGSTVFLDRSGLRQALSSFASPTPQTPHVLIVRGDKPCGKSYTWEFLRHMAVEVAGVQPMPLRLRGRNCTPREFVKQALELLGIRDNGSLPELVDNPQLARTSPLLDAFTSRAVGLTNPYWLVIDDLNEPSVTPAVRETAYAMALRVEDVRPKNLWLALLGYNQEIVDRELDQALQDDADFPTPRVVAQLFKSVADAYGTNLEIERATEITNVMCRELQPLDGERMWRLKRKIEKMVSELKAGRVP
jgi:hypothetical protein